ncbi:hypothetical protein SLEP1_g39173 [Rubroshorea leprosula]|uniref:Leucine-rich repeat-containing N-terminal plant-type domain-containing protein n=1 Tax=Rubroshorea leprosula TaxID=152421 RepID=A0AAV5L056_9ROSI|nr:hypothetical protein SLEP1_g39173 [Rubroshorea leprosula]
MMVLGGRSLQLIYALLILLRMQTSVGFNSTTGDHEIKCIESERQALLAFKQSLVDEYGRFSTWGSEEEKKECCKWKGVQCSNRTGHVTMLTLFGLRGNLNPSLFELQHLVYLDLGVNNFNLSHIPESISSLNKIQHLDLNSCNLSGSLPSQLANLTSLQFLDLSYNEFNIKNLEWLSPLSDLQFLDLSDTDLSKVNNYWPEVINKLPHLSFLQLYRCNLSYDLPQSIPMINTSTSLAYLDLRVNNLSASTFQWLSKFNKSLVHLYLSYNSFQGLIPENVGHMTHLETLDLSGNQFGGIPKSSGNLCKLRYLALSHNNLIGMLPELISNLSGCLQLSLEELILGENKIKGPLPDMIKNFLSLRHLDFYDNQLSDNIPKWFWNLSSWAFHVNLSSNDLYGVLPNLSTTKFADSFGLEIDLSKNKLEGPLPVFPVDVTSINLAENSFSGSISSLCTITSGNLVFLDVSHNQLSGKLPDCMTRWTSLAILNLADNHFFGKIPSSIGSLSRLESLGLQNNNFSGEIPWALRNCSALQFLDLNYNSFSGIIPAWIGERLSSLNFLLLRSNNFSGDIPLQLCWLTNIMLLDLSNNNLSRSIPWCIHNLTALAQKENSARDHSFPIRIDADPGYDGRYVDKASVMWKGMERDYGNGNLKNLRIIDLSSNKLTGEIPVQTSALFELVQLNLSRNQLTGRIPSDIGQMGKLESLDLSQNQLSGHLPGSMSQLNFLSTLNLSYNNFSGRIPLSTQMQSFDASAFVGDPALCGLPLTPTCPGDEKSQSKPTDGGGKDNQEDSAEFWKSFKPGMELGAAIGFVGVLAVKFDHPWKHLCFQLFNNVRVRLSNLKDCLYLLVAAVGFLVREHVSRLGRKLRLFEPSVSS